MPGFLKLSCLKQLYLSNKTDCLSYKGGFGVGISRCLKEIMAWAIDKQLHLIIVMLLLKTALRI